MDADLLAWDAEISGRRVQRSINIGWMSARGRRSGSSARESASVLAMCAWLQRRRCNPRIWPSLGRSACAILGHAAACILAAVGWALEHAPRARLLVPGPHPALHPLLMAGGVIEYVEMFLCSAPPCVDATRYLPSDGAFF